MSQFLGVHGRLEFVYDQEYHYCTPKNFYFYFIFSCCTPKNYYLLFSCCMPKNYYLLFSCCTPKNFYLQCKHTQEYNDLIFHIFTDRFMPDSCEAVPEHNMHESLVLFIKTNYEEVNKIAKSFLRWKGLTLDNYIEYIEKPGNQGDELSIHLLAMM